MSRVDREPVFVLHRRPFRETSLIVELLTARHGRIVGVARGARGPRSSLRAFGEPFRPLEAGWTRRGEMATLTGAEPIGQAVVLSGRALWCGLYANELLLRLLPRDVEEPELFLAYADLLPGLREAERQGPALRRFEWSLLSVLGVAPEIDVVGQARIAVDPDAGYRIDPDRGPEPARGRTAIPGHALRALAAGRTLTAADASALRRPMRELIERQLDGRPLQTPKLYRE
ncbi:DNA repair protein RecO [Wenzhouxiangella sp. XN79A]|uniref:DNA repair protein RecO n=1 Tax=Wenzhouxiangella sp. XN79A TaxID=2724193 RepID=UPI00144AC7CE|nr:DNA repair protein RecO [Wenzhouxiangella sp. XN79A]NKI34407.1 DNA repair protein RecO [Wenzhouxiangella sp. XN79A]